MSSSANTESIVLGGGCFWCTEAVFDRVQGVTDVESGYCNGQVAKPTYEQVCTGRTGAVEVVKVEFDPAVISLREVLEIFFVVHDPTTLNRQGNDVGTQYRSGIYTTSDAQKEVAEGVIREITESKTYKSPIVTEVVPLARLFDGRGLSPGLFPEQPEPGLLRVRRRAQGREVPEDLRGPREGLSLRA